MESKSSISDYKMIFCAKCGELVGIKNIRNNRVFIDGNYCKVCGAKISSKQ